MNKLAPFILILISIPIFNIFPQKPGWEKIPLNTTTHFNSIHFIDPFDLYICGNALFNVSSNDSGITWQVNWVPTPVPFNDIYVFDENTVVTVGNSGLILRTDDGGLNWTIISSGVTDDLLSVSFVDSLGICGARSQTIIYSSDSGESWSIAQSNYVGGGFWGAIMLSPEIGFLAGENSIFQPLLGMTTDSGQSWSFSAFYLNNNEGRATGVDFTDIFVGYTSVRVWDGRGAISKTTNSGNDWVTTFFNNPLWDIDFPISATGLVGYAVGDSGAIYKTYDAGVIWKTQLSPTFERLNGLHFLDFEYGFAVGENGTLLRTTTGGEPVTGIASNSLNKFDFNLEQNFPNPFNSKTIINFTLPNSVMLSDKPAGKQGSNNLVTLIVYDMLGNEVITLIDEEKASGKYEIEFNAMDLPSGIYFYRLKSGKFVNTKKMLLLK